jgi:hypothetical protein
MENFAVARAAFQQSHVVLYANFCLITHPRPSLATSR